MSDPPKKPGSLRDRIAAFENKGTAAPPPPAPRPKPAGGVSWKPRPRSPPPVSNASSDEALEAAKAAGMSAADAKTSIGQGVSLKERMAALQGFNAFGGSAASPPPKPATEKPKWKPPPVVSPPPADDDEKEEIAKPAVVPESESEGDVQEHKPVTEGEPTGEEGEGQAEPDLEEEERQRRAAIAARMARLGGARVGMAPPVFGRKPDIKKPEAPKVADEEHREQESAPAVSPPAVVSPPETASVTSQKSDPTATDYFESKDPEHLSPESAPTPPVRSPAMPVPAGPRRAAPPRKRAPKSPSPAPATVLQEGAVHESPSPLPGAPPAAPEVAAPSIVQAESLGPHGDREPEVAGSQMDALIESVHAADTELAEETKKALADVTPPLVAGPIEIEEPEAEPPAHEDKAQVIAAPGEAVEDAVEDAAAAEAEAEAHEEVAEPTIQAEEHHQQPEEHHLSEQEIAQQEIAQQEKAARRKRIAERLAKAGGVNPLSGPAPPMASPPVSPPLGHSIPASAERRQSLRKDSHGSIGSEKPSSPPLVPTSPKPEVPRRQGSMHSVRSQVSLEHSTRRMSQDERRYSLGEPEPAPELVRTFAEEIVEEPEPHDQHEAIHEEQHVAEDSYLPEETGDEHETVHYYVDPTPVEEEAYKEEEEIQNDEYVQEEVPSLPPPRTHPSIAEAVSPPSRSPSKRLSMPPPRLPPPPPPQHDAEETEEVEPFATHEPVKRMSVSPVAPPRLPPPPPPPHVDEQEEAQEELPPPVHRERRPPVHSVEELSGAHVHTKTPEMTHILVDGHEQPMIHSGPSREDYEDAEYTDELYEEPEYEGYEQDFAEDDDPIEAFTRPLHYQDTLAPLPEAQAGETLDEVEEAPPPPPRRPPVPGQPPRVTSPPLPPGRRPSADQPSRLATPPPVPRPAPLLVTPPAKHDDEVLDDSDGDPIDPGFYSPPKSPLFRTQPLPVPMSPPQTEGPPQAQAPEEDEEDPEQARRRTIAERMAKLGGIRFGAPPPPPPVRRPQPPPESQEAEEGAPQEREGEAQEAPEEEDEFARKQRISARIAGMGGMRFGMMPGAAPPVPRPLARPNSPPAHADESPKTPTVPHRTAPAAPPPPPPAELSEDDDGERIEPEDSEAEEVTYEEAQQDEEEEEAPPPVPSRAGRQASTADVQRPPVPQMTRPPVPQVPTPQPPKRMSVGSANEPPTSSNFTYPPPPPRRPSIPTHDTQNDFVLVGSEEGAEEPPPPPPRTVSLKKSPHPPSRTAPPAPPPLSAEVEGDSGILRVDFGGETDLSLSNQWSEDSTNYPPPPPPPTKGEFVHPSSTRSDVHLSPEELMKQWGRVGVQIHETASVMFDKSKKTLVGDGSYLGFVTAVLSQVPNAAHPAPPFDNFGYLIYMQTGGSVQKRVSEVMPGDIIVIQEAKFKGHKGLQSYNQTAGVGEPLYAIVCDHEVKKSKVKVFQANQHVGQQTVESVSYRLEDLKSGSVKIFRVMEA